MTEQYATPASPDSVDWQAINGSLLLVQPLASESGIPTVHGPANAVRANITVLDGPKAGEHHEDALIFPRVLQGQVRSRIGQRVLGRLGQGVAKPGQTAPWMLLEATAQDIERANAFGRQQQQATSGSQSAPQGSQVGQPGTSHGWGQQQSAQPPF